MGKGSKLVEVHDSWALRILVSIVAACVVKLGGSSTKVNVAVDRKYRYTEDSDL